MNYDKAAFLAGYEAAFALRGAKSAAIIAGCKQAVITDPYTLSWNSQTSFTVTWKTKPGIVQGVILLPDLFPVTITGVVNSGSGSFQWGLCAEEASLPTVISQGAYRITFDNGIPTDVVIKDNTHNLRSAYCGELNAVAGAEYTLTVEW